MKKIMVLLFVISAIGALYFPKDTYWSLFFKMVSLGLLVFIIMKLMAKVPSKNSQENSDDDEK